MFGKTSDFSSTKLGSFCGLTATALIVSLLGGCVGTEELVSKAAAAGVTAETKTVTVDKQDIILGRAGGYCFNDRQSRTSATGAFVVMGPCDSTDENSNAKGLVTINVLSQSGIGEVVNPEKLEDYLQSTAGRAALSRSGDAEKLEILGTMSEKGFLYVHTKDAGGPIIPDTTEDLWRVFFVVSDRLISVSVINFVDDLMPDGLVFAHMERIAHKIQSLNP